MSGAVVIAGGRGGDRHLGHRAEAGDTPNGCKQANEPIDLLAFLLKS